MKRIVLRSWNDKECEDAYRILGEIVGGVGIDRPVNSYSRILERGKKIDGLEWREEDKVLTVMVSGKGFPELFGGAVVARRIDDALEIGSHLDIKNSTNVTVGE